MIMKKSHDRSIFRVVNVRRQGYIHQTLEHDDHRDVLQVQVLNDGQVIVEYGDWEELIDDN